MNTKIEIKKNVFHMLYDFSIKLDVEIFIVGGAIRDYLIDNIRFEDAKDIDFAVFGHLGNESEYFSRLFCKEVKGAFVVLDDSEKSYRVVYNGVYFDFTQQRGKTLEDDLRVRDFTINAFAVKLDADFCNGKVNIIDKLGSMQDLQNKCLRVISNKNFTQDPLRLLRAFRIAAKYKFEIEKNTLKFIKQHAALINISSMERIHEEIVKFFSYDDIFEYVVLMDKAGLLGEIFDAVVFMKKHSEYYFHKLGLWGHSLEVLFCFEFILKKIDKLFTPEEMDLFNINSSLKLACLFHDLGKPDTFSLTKGKVHFINHDIVGEKQIKKMLKKIKFSKKEVKYISQIALFHMQTGNLAKEKEISQRAAFRFFKRTEGIGLDLLLFTLSDWLASIRGVENIDYFDGISESSFEYLDFKRCIKSVKTLLAWYLEKLNKKTIKMLLNGNDIMDKFDIPPSKFLGEILEKLEEGQMTGNIKNKKQAYTFVEKIIYDNKKQQK